jgi:hypothetical protein
VGGAYHRIVPDLLDGFACRLDLQGSRDEAARQLAVIDLVQQASCALLIGTAGRARREAQRRRSSRFRNGPGRCATRGLHARPVAAPSPAGQLTE